MEQETKLVTITAAKAAQVLLDAMVDWENTGKPGCMDIDQERAYDQLTYACGIALDALGEVCEEADAWLQV